MSIYQTADGSGAFSYELKYSQDNYGFSLDSVSVQRHDKVVFSKLRMNGVYRSEAILLAQGINMCEAVADYFRAV